MMARTFTFTGTDEGSIDGIDGTAEATPTYRSTYLPPAAEIARPYSREYEEGISAVRGIMVGLLCSLPIWGVVVGFVYFIATR